MATFKKISFVILFTLLNSGCLNNKNIVFRAAPSMNTDLCSDINTPGFWISRLQDPNKIIMSGEEIKTFNTSLSESLDLINDITKAPMLFSEQKLYKDLSSSLKDIAKKTLYLENAEKVTDELITEITNNMNLNDLSFEGTCEYALVTKHSDIRLIPTDTGFFRDQVAQDIDELQVDTLEIGMPLAVMHESNDMLWYYVSSKFNAGWIKAENIVFCEHKTLKDYCQKTPFVVVTKTKGELFEDTELNIYSKFAKMGTRLPIYAYSKEDSYKVLVPTRSRANDIAFTVLAIGKKDVREGYLPYTPKNVIYQAFELLDAPCSHGNKFAAQDCTKFIQQIFAVVGVILPSDFSSLSKAGRVIKKFDPDTKENEKQDTVIKQAVVGATILVTNDHAMFYLGKIDSRPFVIHEMTGYFEKRKKCKVFQLIKRAVVSDLSLGNKSPDGSLLKRLDSIREIQ